MRTVSLLPGWSRLTVACHLRHGAEALRRMTDEALSGRPTSYYPAGRATQRPMTLAPRQGDALLLGRAPAGFASDDFSRAVPGP